MHLLNFLACIKVSDDLPKLTRDTPVDLYLISEKSIWKNQVRQTGFLVYFKPNFYCLCSLQKSISKLVFVGWKSSSLNLSFPTWFFKIQVQINRGIEHQGKSIRIAFLFLSSQHDSTEEEFIGGNNLPLEYNNFKPKTSKTFLWSYNRKTVVQKVSKDPVLLIWIWRFWRYNVQKSGSGSRIQFWIPLSHKNFNSKSRMVYFRLKYSNTN